MVKKTIDVRSWDEVYKEFLESKSDNPKLFQLLSNISKKLDGNSKNYVYCIQFEYGDTIIKDGKITVTKDSYSLKATKENYPNSFSQFKEDLAYSNDPLGIVLTNSVEVFTENRCKIKKGREELCSYTVPLNIINPGDLFGLFGTLNYLVDENEEDIEEHRWHAKAGNISFHIAFPFGNNPAKEIHYKKFLELGEPNQLTNDCRIQFINKYSSNEESCVKIVYLPKPFIDQLKNYDFPVIKCLLLEKGWGQSAHLRSFPFVSASLSNQWRNLSNTETLYYKNDIHFLNILTNYLVRAGRGRELVLKPKFGGTIINKAINKFKEEEISYFQNRNANEPLPFVYDRLEQNEWGLLSLYCLPIIHNYTINYVSKLASDLAKIENHKIQKLPNIIGFSRTGNTNNYFIKPKKKKDTNNKLLTSYISNAFENYKSKNNIIDSSEFNPAKVTFNSSKKLEAFFLIERK